eukprot:gb/GECG01002081.1/.p1 GENE.gb/GECG01002081.1/~~gb/GECG01002081.1/.p1  ORF type:complete len:114 (+),score=9.14 gb/GECG01002081.1/:1-342(+)
METGKLAFKTFGICWGQTFTQSMRKKANIPNPILKLSLYIVMRENSTRVLLIRDELEEHIFCSRRFSISRTRLQGALNVENSVKDALLSCKTPHAKLESMRALLQGVPSGTCP